jgi:hypothetical protein
MFHLTFTDLMTTFDNPSSTSKPKDPDLPVPMNPAISEGKKKTVR